MPARQPVRRLVVVLGDQLDRESAVFDGFDPARDAVWMAEVREESTHVRSNRVRIANFFACMRHFRDDMVAAGRRVVYTELDAPGNRGSLAAELTAAVAELRPAEVVMVMAGDYRVRESLRAACRAARVPLAEVEDRHFFATPADFDAHVAGRKQWRLEFFYRELRKKHHVLMDGREPAGGSWNYDAANRGSFGKAGPGLKPPPPAFPPDAVTRGVLELVGREFPDHPGRLDSFDWPVTPADAEAALADFVALRLPDFGTYQDAMWTAEPVLYHARLSSAMNLKLLNPRKVVAAAEAAYRAGAVSLEAAEGFVRQILGWREYVRGVYWHAMPDYLTRNYFAAVEPLPAFYWTADTDMNCLAHALRQTLDTAYAHHIQRLMVTGLFALLLGVEPRQVHEWYLAVYIDAVEWVEVPNVLGMSQYADGGRMASKPYAATGKYIDRMSNYCKGCKYDPAERVGDTACPFTTLYWDFLLRHADGLRPNNRMVMQVKNADRLSDADKVAVPRAGRADSAGAGGRPALERVQGGLSKLTVASGEVATVTGGRPSRPGFGPDVHHRGCDDATVPAFSNLGLRPELHPGRPVRATRRIAS